MDISFNNEYEWESDFPDGGAVANVYAFDTRINVNNGDFGGWAIVAEGFLLNSPVLTVVGSVIGCSGAILTKIMSDAMNRDIFNVIFGGMNVAAPVKKSGEEAPKVHVETSVVNVAELLSNSKEVLIVPGYGMAVSRAQGSVGEIARICRDKGATVKFGIHPVAGRMPGQMNVLLAEAGVPREWVLEMNEVVSYVERQVFSVEHYKLQ